MSSEQPSLKNGVARSFLSPVSATKVQRSVLHKKILKTNAFLELFRQADKKHLSPLRLRKAAVLFLPTTDTARSH